MSFADNMRILSNICCGLSSADAYINQRQSGVSTGTATYNLIGNLLNGFARNEVAYGMQMMGNPMGNTINAFAGYGNSFSNAIGTVALLGANCSPNMFFGMCAPMPCTFPMFGYNPMICF